MAHTGERDDRKDEGGAGIPTQPRFQARLLSTSSHAAVVIYTAIMAFIAVRIGMAQQLVVLSARPRFEKVTDRLCRPTIEQQDGDEPSCCRGNKNTPALARTISRPHPWPGQTTTAASG